MRKCIVFTAIMSIVAFGIQAQIDTMYIMKSGIVVGKYNVNTEIDSIIFYQPQLEEPTSGTFTDSRDGNTYGWTKIGDQVWMTENLRYLPSVSQPDNISETEPRYYVIGTNTTNVETAKSNTSYINFGTLYNCPAAEIACPAGWHIPTDAEWLQLINYAGGLNLAGGKLKETGNSFWQEPNYNATNEYGFSARPGGWFLNGTYFFVGEYAVFWNAATPNTSRVWMTALKNDLESIYYRTETDKHCGVSIRCIKD